MSKLRAELRPTYERTHARLHGPAEMPYQLIQTVKSVEN